MSGTAPARQVQRVAAAILLDALVVRTILVPTAMQLFGKGNWYLPKAIDRALPHVSAEGPVDAPPITPSTFAPQPR